MPGGMSSAVSSIGGRSAPRARFTHGSTRWRCPTGASACKTTTRGISVGKSSFTIRSAWRRIERTVRRRSWRARRAKAWRCSRGCCCVGIVAGRLTVRYTGNGGIYPRYQCNWLRRESLGTSKECLNIRCDLLDAAVSEEVLKALQPDELELALAGLAELEWRDQALGRP